MRLYLDACCLSRPFDDQSQMRVRLETEAVSAIFERVQTGRWIVVSSSVLEYEISRIPDWERRARTMELLSIAQERVRLSARERERAEVLRRALGLSALDALHLACAESAGVHAFLTTDDRLSERCAGLLQSRVP